MHIKREWVTPVVAGTFLLLGCTGILMFFHLDTGMNKLAHEWLGWVLVAAVILHLTVNFRGLLTQLKQPRGTLLAGLFVLLLGLNFLPTGEDSGPQGREAFVATARALAQAPLPLVAELVGVDEQGLVERLAAAGYTLAGQERTLGDIVGEDPKKQVGLFAQVLRQAR